MNTFFAHVSAFIKSKGATIAHGALAIVATVAALLSGFTPVVSGAIALGLHTLLHWMHFDGSNTVAPIPSTTINHYTSNYETAIPDAAIKVQTPPAAVSYVNSVQAPLAVPTGAVPYAAHLQDVPVAPVEAPKV